MVWSWPLFFLLDVIISALGLGLLGNSPCFTSKEEYKT